MDARRELRRKDLRILQVAILVGILHGLLYVIIVPPWQHYDEPSHFEFAWLMANDETPTGVNHFDPWMRRELASSMIENDFFRNMEIKPNLLLQENEIWIGVSQINERYLYYSLAGAILKVFSGSDIGFQLLIARLFSLGFFLLCIVSAWGIAREITPPDHPIRWMLPISITLLPGFVDILSSVNDDAGAGAFFSLFLWCGVRIIARGFTWRRLIILVILAGICFWIKNTVTIAALIIVLPILLSLLQGRALRFGFAALAAGFILLGFAVIKLGDAAFWIRFTFPDLRARQAESAAPHGQSVFRIPVREKLPGPRLAQVIPHSAEQKLRGKTVTLGSWIWSNKPGKVRTPLIVTDENTSFQEVEVGTEPTFFSFRTNIDSRNGKLNIVLSPKSFGTDDFEVYYDGIVLTQGKMPEDAEPVFDDPRGSTGTWGSRSFSNILRNGSAEAAWPWIRSWADELFSENFPGRLSIILAFIIDQGAALGYYKAATERVVHSFWAGFGWGHIPLLGSLSNPLLDLFSALGLAGAGVGLIRKRKKIPWKVVIFLGTAMIFIWVSTIVRGTSSILDGHYLFPVARYTYVAVIPVMLTLNFGWLEIFRMINKNRRIPDVIGVLIFCLAFLGLSALGLITVITFYSSN